MEQKERKLNIKDRHKTYTVKINKEKRIHRKYKTYNKKKQKKTSKQTNQNKRIIRKTLILQKT